MAQGPLSEQFDNMKESLQADGNNFALALKGLQILRGVVQQLRDSGFDASLEVRPAGHGSTVPDVSDAVVNGTLTMEGMAIEFIFQKEGYAGRQYFHAYVGNTRIENVQFRRDETEWLRNTAMRMMLGVKAQAELLEEFNIAANGASGTTRVSKLDKSVLPKPPKLKAGP